MYDVIGKSFERATIFEPGFGTGYRQSEIRSLTFRKAPDQWGQEHMAAEFIFRGKRRQELVAVDQAVVINGWDHPLLDRWVPMSENTTPGAMTARYHAFSEQWDTLLDQHLAALGDGLDILYDGRAINGSMYAVKAHQGMGPACDVNTSDIHTTTHAPGSPPKDSAEILIEGVANEYQATKYERNPIARQRCIDHYGCRCHACLASMEEIYGEHGRDCIEVHHRVLLSEIKEGYTVDPIRDLVPLCPNCHAIIHRQGNTFSVEQLRESIQRRNSVHPLK